MSEDIPNITYARGRVVELQEQISTLQTQLKHIKLSLRSVVSQDEISVSEAKALLSDYEDKSTQLSELFKKLFEIKKSWGLE